MEFQQLERRDFLRLSGLGAASAFLASCGLVDAEKSEEVLRAAYTQPIPTLNPYEAGSTVHEPALMARRLIFDTLCRRDKDGITGQLATSWTQQDDTTWVFDIRRDVTFQDGRPLTAADIKASLDFMRSHPTEQSPLWDPVTAVEATDDHTITITTDGPLGTLPVSLTLLFISPAEKVDDAAFFRKPMGSGPYQVASFTPSAQLKLSAAADYWGRAGRTRSIELPYIQDTASAITSLRNDEIQLLWPIPPDQVGEASEAEGVELEQVVSWVFYAIWFNSGRKPFNDPRVRRALWHAVDVASLVKQLFGEGARQMRAPIPSTVFGYAEQEPYRYDPGLAKELLREAGLGEGLSTSMMWFDDTGPLARQLAQAFISAWGEVGVKVEPQSIQRAQWVERLNNLDWDMELQTHAVSTGDADYNLGRLYVSDANRMGYSNPELDNALKNGARAFDSNERKSHYERACKIIWDDAVGIYSANLVTTYGLRDNVEGFIPASNNQPDLSAVSLAG